MMDIQEFAKDVFGITLTEAQLKMLDCKKPKMIHRQPRVVGKSLTFRIFSMYIASQYDGSRVAIATHTWGSALKQRSIVKTMIADSKLLDEVAVINSGTIQFMNGSTIDILNHIDVVKPDCSWDLVLLDEPQAYTSPKFLEILNWVVYPDGYVIGAGTWLPGTMKVPEEYTLVE